MMPKVKAYLADMDIDQYWIDRMFSANSQQYYIYGFMKRKQNEMSDGV
jgi:hypothetical protein